MVGIEHLLLLAGILSLLMTRVSKNDEFCINSE